MKPTVEGGANPVRARLGRAARVAGSGSAVLLLAALLYLALFDPRLLTLDEILPPDEGLVTALLPGSVMAAVTVVLAQRLRHTPSEVHWDSTAVEFFGDGAPALGPAPWSSVRIARSDPWGGAAVYVRDSRGADHRLYVDDSLVHRWPLAAAAASPPPAMGRRA